MSRIFIAVSYTDKINYVSGEIYTEFQDWLEQHLEPIEALGHEVYCPLRADDYRVSGEADPAEVIRSELDEIDKADVVIAFLPPATSAGVQSKIGYAIAKLRRVIAVYEPGTDIDWTNSAFDKSDLIELVPLPLDPRLI